MVTLVRLMTFFSYGFPLVRINLREEGIGLGRLIADMGEIQSVGHSYRLTIEGLTTDDKNLFVGEQLAKADSREENTSAPGKDNG